MEKPLKNKSRGLIGIVDAYSSGNMLAEAFLAKGFKCLHIQTSKLIPPIYRGSERPEFFFKTIINENFDNTVAILKSLSPIAIIPGTETGVDLADELSVSLSLPSNDQTTMGARRDKFLMQEKVRLAGLRSITQIKVKDAATALGWVAEECGYPVVVKPLASAGSDSIYICNNKFDLDAAINSLVGTNNVLGQLNEYALVQKQIFGEQYVVNSVSYEGLHIITDIWHSRRVNEKGRKVVYDYAELLPSCGLLQEILVEYTTKILHALGIKFGPAHTELFVTQEGPILIETGARMVGSGVPNIVTSCVGISQLELTVLSCIDVDMFKAHAKPYSLKKHARLVALISRQEGTLLESPDISSITKLPSFHHARMYLKKGDFIKKTIDLISSPGDIHLIHIDKHQVEHDYSEVRSIEQRIFKVTVK